MKRTSFIWLTLLVLITSSCSIYDIRSRDVSPEYHPAKKSADEVTYIENVSGNYEIIGYVTVNTERNQSREKILLEMKQEAANLGGDAITDIRTNAGTGKWATIKPKQIFANTNIRANYIVTVVVFK